MSDGTDIRRIDPIRLEARVADLLVADGAGFATRSVDALDLTFEGIEKDRHGGTVRRSGGREPWYKRGTPIRNDRQISILCPLELRETAEALEMTELRAEWLGGNLVIERISRLSWLPPRTLLLFDGGASVRIEGDNAPCRKAGRALVALHPDRPELERSFVKAARRRRGLVGWVEKPGRVMRGEALQARLPEQWIYT